MSREKFIKKNEIEYEEGTVIIPSVIYEEPKIKIYDGSNDGTYWFSKIGFNRKITDES